MLNQITEVNNFLSHNYRPAKFNPIRDLKQYMLCEGHDHTFYRTRTDLLTNKVIQNVVHFVSKHTTPANLLRGKVIEISKGRGRNFLVDVVFYQSVPLLSTREVGIAFFKEEIRRVKSGKDLQFIHVEYEKLIGDTELCLNEKIDLLETLAKTCQARGIRKTGFPPSFRQKLEEGANFLAYKYFLSLYHNRPFEHENPGLFFRVVGPFVSILNVDHPLYTFNKICALIDRSWKTFDGLFPHAETVVIRHFDLSPDKINPLIVIGKMLNYQDRREKNDVNQIGLDIRDECDDKFLAFIQRYFPASSFNPDGNMIKSTFDQIESLIVGKLNHEEHHGKAAAAALCLTEQAPFVGPLAGAAHKFSTADATLAMATVFDLVGETSESLLRMLEISHVLGVSHILQEMHTVMSVSLSALPVIGTVCLSASLLRNGIKLHQLVGLRSRISLLQKTAKTSSLRVTQQKISNFLNKGIRLDETKVKTMILSSMDQIDPRLQEATLEVYSEKFAGKQVRKWKQQGTAEICRALHEAVQDQYSLAQIKDIVGKMMTNLNRRIATETVKFLKTIVTLGLSVSGMIIPFNPFILLAALGINVLGSIALGVTEHVLENQEFVSGH